MTGVALLVSCGGIVIALALVALAHTRARLSGTAARLLERDAELLRAREQHAQAERALREEHAAQQRDLRIEHAEAQRAQELEARELREARTRLEAERAKLEAELHHAQTGIADMQDRFARLSSEALDRSAQQFATLAEQVLKRAEESSKSELDKREQAVAALVKPVHDSLQKVDQQIKELEHRSFASSGQLSRHMQTVAESNDKLRKEAERLVNALRQPSQRGRWGEQQLRNTVDLAGLREYVDFLEQPVVQTADGTLRPDLAVRLPGNKTVLVDSKVPFEAFARAVEADEHDRPALLAKHAEQLRAHIGQLAKKQYWEAFAGSPEMIVLFLPGEGFLGAALDVDPLLHEDAFKQRVVLATPATLLALLLTVAHVWKQESIALNAREIANQGRELHKRIADLASHFAKLGRSLDSAVDTYNKAIGSFERRLVPAARRFEDLKAASVDVTVEALPGLELRPRLPASSEPVLPDDAN